MKFENILIENKNDILNYIKEEKYNSIKEILLENHKLDKENNFENISLKFISFLNNHLDNQTMFIACIEMREFLGISKSKVDEVLIITENKLLSYIISNYYKKLDINYVFTANKIINSEILNNIYENHFSVFMEIYSKVSPFFAYLLNNNNLLNFIEKENIFYSLKEKDFFNCLLKHNNGYLINKLVSKNIFSKNIIYSNIEHLDISLAIRHYDFETKYIQNLLERKVISQKEDIYFIINKYNLDSDSILSIFDLTNNENILIEYIKNSALNENDLFNIINPYFKISILYHVLKYHILNNKMKNLLIKRSNETFETFDKLKSFIINEYEENNLNKNEKGKFKDNEKVKSF